MPTEPSAAATQRAPAPTGRRALGIAGERALAAALAVPGARDPARRLGAALALRARILFAAHWDVGAFDVAFGCLKAFLVYPGLVRLSLAWALPLCEALVLNTQLWTLAYLALRGRIAALRLRLRTGHRRAALAALRQRLFGAPSAGADSRHRFAAAGAERALTVAGGRGGATWRRLRGLPDPRDTVSQRELEQWAAYASGEPDFIARARALAVNPYLYQRALLQRALAHPESRRVLLARVGPAPTPAPHPLHGLVSESHAELRARALDAASRYAAAARRQLGRVDSLPLRWHGRSLLRDLLRRERSLARLEERLLADALDGAEVPAPERVLAATIARGEARACLEQLVSLADAAEEAAPAAGRTVLPVGGGPRGGTVLPNGTGGGTVLPGESRRGSWLPGTRALGVRAGLARAAGELQRSIAKLGEALGPAGHWSPSR